MAREIDLSKPLSQADIKYLRQRHSLAYVARMVELAAGDAEPSEAEDNEEGNGVPESNEEPAEAEDSSEELTEDDGEDLIGALYDPFAHTTREVRDHLKDSGPEERERIWKLERERTDREPRTSITEYDPS